MDTRKNIKVTAAVKNRLNDVKKMIPFKTESEALAYLILVNSWAMEKMPTNVYRDAIKMAKQLNEQSEFTTK
jgi:hypothetical protein